MRKVVIIGAGHVGSHCGYALAHSGIAGEIVLVDVDKDKAHAQALDIADSVSFCVDPFRGKQPRTGRFRELVLLQFRCGTCRRHPD